MNDASRKLLFALSLPLTFCATALVGAAYFVYVGDYFPILILALSFGASFFIMIGLIPAIFFLEPGLAALKNGNKAIGLILSAIGLGWVHLLITVAIVGGLRAMLSRTYEPASAFEVVFYCSCLIFPFVFYNVGEGSGKGDAPSVGTYAWHGSAIGVLALVTAHLFVRELALVWDFIIVGAVAFATLAFELRILATKPEISLTDLR